MESHHQLPERVKDMGKGKKNFLAEFGQLAAKFNGKSFTVLVGIHP